MWKLVGQSPPQMVTRELAHRFATMPAPLYDRKLDDRRLRSYRASLAAGKMRPLTWATVTCLATGATYRTNGKHTATLLAQADPLPPLQVTIESYVADTLADVADLFSTFDSRLQTRTHHQIYGVSGATTPGLEHLTARVLALVYGADSYVKWGERAHSHLAIERVKLAPADVPFGEWFRAMLAVAGGAPSLARVPVAAAMLESWRKDAVAAAAFWAEVRDETGASPKDPTRMLGRWLAVNEVARGARGNPRGATGRVFLYKCALAWNAWRRAGTTDLRYFEDRAIPRFT